MSREELKNYLLYYRDRFGSSVTWLAEKLNINRATLSIFLNDTRGRETKDFVIERIRKNLINLPTKLDD